MRSAVNGISITKDGILLVRKGQFWILPGGKPEEDETDLECLVRELGEELPEVSLIGLPLYYGQVIGTTPHQGDQLLARLYFIEIDGRFTPGAEISEACRIAAPTLLNLSDITRKAVIALQQSGHL